jgi:plastocyanin
VIVWLLLLLAGVGASPKTHTVEIRGMEFHPAVLTVAVGDTVVWINRDIVPHTATAGGATKWDTGQLLQGQTGRYVANRAGVARYRCTFHPTMLGKLIVTSAIPDS